MKFLHMIGNAHLDLAWLWNWQEGFAEAKATFLSALQRLDEFDGFIFTSSSAQYYAWIETNAPDIFQRIKTQIAMGRWVICGGWWVQPDCNLPCAESFVRQGLYGQQYFLEHFGVTASVGYNVDSFGHNAGLPQILAKSSMDSYVFLRPAESELDLPRGAFRWYGSDDSSVLACRIPVNYSSIISLSESIQDALDRFPEASDHYICFYGVGNHGGGPTISNIRYILSNITITEDCQLVFSDPREYFDSILKENQALPYVKGELQHHAPGCYSVAPEIKYLNRQAEHALSAAEIFSVLESGCMARETVDCPLDDAWKRVLACQFHDVLTGACILEVCEDAKRAIGGACAEADRIANNALQTISFAIDIPFDDGCQPLVVFNPHSFPVKTIIYHEKGSWGNFSFHDPCRVLSSSGKSVPFQFVSLTAQLDERKRIAIEAELPPLGYETFRITSAQEYPVSAAAHPLNVLENEFVKIVIDKDTGLLSCYYDKINHVDFLTEGSGRFVAHKDPTDTWAHGSYRFQNAGKDAQLISIKRIEDGAVLQRIQVLFQLGKSVLRQRYTLQSNDSALDVETCLNWQDHQTCLKVYYSIPIHKTHAYWEVPFGAIERPTTGVEEPMQSWVDVTGVSDDGEHVGLAIVSKGIGGGHVDNAELGLTLLRSPAFSHHAPHPLDNDPSLYDFCSQGMQQFHYQLIPHIGPWQSNNITQRALALNRPPVKIVETFHSGSMPQHYQGIQIDAKNILMSCLKAAYDGNGIILRLWESCGESTTATIHLPLLKMQFSTDFGAYEVKTFRVQPGVSVAECLLTEMLPAAERKG